MRGGGDATPLPLFNLFPQDNRWHEAKLLGFIFTEEYMEKIIYKCSKCGWSTSIRSEWGDLRPKRCMGKIQSKSCGTSFLKEPSALLIEHPTKPVVVAIKKVEKEKENVKRPVLPSEA